MSLSRQGALPPSWPFASRVWRNREPDLGPGSTALPPGRPGPAIFPSIASDTHTKQPLSPLGAGEPAHRKTSVSGPAFFVQPDHAIQRWPARIQPVERWPSKTGSAIPQPVPNAILAAAQSDRALLLPNLALPAADGVPGVASHGGLRSTRV